MYIYAIAGVELELEVRETLTGHSMELHCIVSGQINTSRDNVETHIHFEHKNDSITVTTELNCTYKEVQAENSMQSSATCTTALSHLESGHYFCTIVMGDEHFMSNMGDVRNEGGGLSKLTITEISGGVGLLLLLVSVVSIGVNLYMCYKRKQHQNVPGGDPGYEPNEQDRLIGGGTGISLVLYSVHNNVHVYILKYSLMVYAIHTHTLYVAVISFSSV